MESMDVAMDSLIDKPKKATRSKVKCDLWKNIARED